MVSLMSHAQVGTVLTSSSVKCASGTRLLHRIVAVDMKRSNAHLEEITNPLSLLKSGQIVLQTSRLPRMASTVQAKRGKSGAKSSKRQPVAEPQRKRGLFDFIGNIGDAIVGAVEEFADLLESAGKA